MNPSEFLDVLERLLVRLRKGDSGSSIRPAERTLVRSVIGAWFEQYKPSFEGSLGSELPLKTIDERLQSLLKLAAKQSSRIAVGRVVSSIKQCFTDQLLFPLSRAYWSRVPERTSAGYDHEVASRLTDLGKDLGASYEQVALDLENEGRLTYRGPASELREILTGVLHQLAPTDQVQQTEWYREARRSGVRVEPTPTRAERTKFILRSRAQGTAAEETAESYMTTVEDRLANIVNATYRRGSAATHVGAERGELAQLLQYVNALLRELLPPSGEATTLK
jgi:hypothetical protein